MKVLKTVLFFLSFFATISAFASGPRQVRVSAQYLLSYYGENLVGAGYSYHEFTHKMGLELSIGKYFGIGGSRLLIPVRSEITGKHTYSGWGGFVKGRYTIPQYPQFEAYILAGTFLSDYCLTQGPFYFPCDKGERYFLGGGIGLDWNFHGKWVLSGRMSDFIAVGTFGDDLANFMQLGIKRDLFLRVDNKR